MVKVTPLLRRHGGWRGQGGPSKATVMRAAGVPIATVRRVVNDVPKKVSMQTLARVDKVIAALNYRPMRAGIAFDSGQDHSS